MKTQVKYPKIIVFVVYPIKQDDWRAFSSPYDVSCNAPTRKEALKRLEKLVALYEEGLQKYGFPKHLTMKPLSDPQDEKVFKLVMRREVEKKLAKKLLTYQLEEERRNRLKIRSHQKIFSGYYYQPSLTM